MRFLLALLFSLSAVLTSSAARSPRNITIPIHDFTGPAWNGYVAEDVQKWNTVLADRHIVLNYIREAEDSCPLAKQPSGVSFCEWTPLQPSPLPTGEAYGDSLGNYQQGLVRFYVDPGTLPWPDRARQLTCIELGHVFDLDYQPLGVDSCLAPMTNTPEGANSGPTTWDGQHAMPYRLKTVALRSSEHQRRADHHRRR